MRPLRSTALALGLVCLFSLSALSQTYTPKQIRFEGATGMDTNNLLGIAAVKPGTPITKEQIEAALQRLGDTGMFSDLGYTVGSDALVFKLAVAASSQSLSVRYSNFVWWKPSELTALIQARVPLYQGRLPLTGNLTDQVEAALVAMLKEKGVDAAVTIVESAGGHSVALEISRPAIVLGNIHVEGSLPAVATLLAQMQAGFAGQDFDQQLTAKAITVNVTDLYNNAGYLDATAEPATFAAPRKDIDLYAVDATTAVHPGELYRIRQLNFDAPSTLSRSDLEKAVALKPGDPAGIFPLQHAADSLAHAYTLHGYLDAVAQHEYPKDTATHTVDANFTVTPGELYHLSNVDASALSPSLQAALAHDPKLAPGVPADQTATNEIAHILNDAHLLNSVRIVVLPNKTNHTASIALKPHAAK
jgi:outer membrane protein assembly factor BamA